MSIKLKNPLFYICLISSLISFSGQSMALDKQAAPFDDLDQRYEKSIKPILKKFCMECHSTEDQQGELDLEQFKSFGQVRKETGIWLKVREFLDLGEMPPDESPQLSKPQKDSLHKWIKDYLSAEALENAGDPGPVILRRLNNSEYNYTIQDLIGVDINPSKEFPVDGAAGEGFTNTGSALVMSPSLVTKYLDSGKRIANHMVLLPDGFRFANSDSRRDWTNEILDDIRTLYFRYTGRLGDASALNRWNVSDPRELTDRDGRVNLKMYFDFLNQHRSLIKNDPGKLAKLAGEQKLSPVYVEHLRKMLLADNNSQLLKEIQAAWNQSGQLDESMISAIQAWQEKLFEYNAVGHFGLVSGWQKPVPLVSQVSDFRIKIEKSAKNNDVKIYLVTGNAGDGNEADYVTWNDARIERNGQPTIYLKDVEGVSFALEQIKKELASNMTGYLQAAFEAKNNGQKFDIKKISSKYQLDQNILKPLLAYLGIVTSDEWVIEQYLTQPINGLAGYKQVKGWGITGLSALSIVSNNSDSTVNIPGQLDAHKIVVHPRPERWIAASWKSPIDGKISIKPHLLDAHPQCGNGVSWSLEFRRGHQKKSLKSGNINRGKGSKQEEYEDLEVRKDDLISIVIGPRDGDHSCDLTEIDLTINETSGEKRNWSLSGDCVERMGTKNPLSDKFGHEKVWHFHVGLIKPVEEDSTIPEKSLITRWLLEKDEKSAGIIASEIQELLSNGITPKLDDANKALYKQLMSLQGPLFSQVNMSKLVNSVKDLKKINSKYGLDRTIFGKDANGNPINPLQLHVKAPSVVEVVLPAELFAGGEFVTSASLSGLAGSQSSVQFQVLDHPPENRNGLIPGAHVVTNANSKAEERFKKAFEDFRQLFPSAMCYTRIVPVDVVVSLVLYFREDQNYARLMLNEDEQKQLDRLWNELHYVSEDAFTSVTVFEQLLEFASQDDNPARFMHLKKVIHGNSDSYKKQLVQSEPTHLNQLMGFTARAYRRPLSESEKTKLTQLYKTLRKEEMSHEEAFRLLFARVLSSPSFLYKIEKPLPGEESSPITDRELASRLSYFLWSSSPDEKLLALASKGELHDPKILAAQAKRMIQDQRIRRMVIEYACQWMHIRDFDQHDEKNERLYPQFGEIRSEMYEESIQYFEDLFRKNRSILNLLDSNYTFLNEKLAKHYQIPGVTGPQWRLVEGVNQYGRGGILTQASILSKHSGASRTSPILRGIWVSETILGEKLPKPPADVPVLTATLPEGLTERQLIEKHSSIKGCVKCHKRIDPYGFALENYDTIGRFRKVSSNNQKIDTKSTLMDGTKIAGLAELQQYLMNTRRDAFIKQACKKLLGYALGRKVLLSDEPLLDQMKMNLEKNDYRIGSAIETIVLSRQFREIRGRDYSGIK